MYLHSVHIKFFITCFLLFFFLLIVGDEGERERGGGHETSDRLRCHELALDTAYCTRLGPCRNDGVGLAPGDPRSGPPASFGLGLASPGHCGLGHDDARMVPQRDSGYDSPEELAYAALEWEARSAGLDTDSD
uniref:Uncharacterized protein n=1 Tax=Ixodes ricinus TaxID=34613 RepID=A0A147BEL2_IXORI